MNTDMDAHRPTGSEGLGPAALPGLAHRQPRNAARWAMIVLSLVGAWLSFDLWRLGQGVAATNPILALQCGESSGGDCVGLLRSAWGYIPLSDQPGGPRIPLSALGVSYFLAIFLWCMLVGPPTLTRRLSHLPLILFVAAGLLQSFGSISVMAFTLHRWCGGCVAVHVINAVLALLVLLSFPWRSERAAMADHPRGRLVLAGLLASGLVFLLPPAAALLSQVSANATQSSRLYREIVEDSAFAVWNYERQAAVDLSAVSADRFPGPADARHTIVAFTDLQCPRCRDLNQIIDRLAAAHPGLVRVAHLYFPLNSACNAAVSRNMHPDACDAARAVEAVVALAGPVAGEKMRRALFENQDSLRDAVYVEAALAAGVNEREFNEKRRSEETLTRIAADTRLAKTLGIAAAPAVYVDGRRLTYWTTEATWRAVLKLPSSDGQPASADVLPANGAGSEMPR